MKLTGIRKMLDDINLIVMNVEDRNVEHEIQTTCTNIKTIPSQYEIIENADDNSPPFKKARLDSTCEQQHETSNEK